MYLLIDRDGEITEVDTLPDGISWDSWPKVIEIKLYGDYDCEVVELTIDGWKEV